MSTATASTPSSSRTPTRSRSGSTAWCSSRATRTSEDDPMTESLGAGAAASGRVRLNIGEGLDRLRPDFPGVTLPKIRFLEYKGLVKPERPPSWYRKFSTDDIERLRYVLRMQRDHYLPLKVIGEHLDAIDRGLEPPPIEPVVPTVPTVALAADGTPSPESFRRRDDLRLSRKELVKVAEVSEELLDQLEQFGLVSPRPGTGHYDTDALVVVRTAREL